MKKKILSAIMAAAIMLTAVAVPLPGSHSRPTANSYAADYADSAAEEYALQVAAIVNRERAANGLSALKFSDELSNAALVRAQEIQTNFSHTRPDGTSCFTAMTERGITYRYAGENIAYGQRTPDEVMTAWMNSSGHRANILNKNVEYIGIGVAKRRGVYYWTQFFAASDSLTGTVITENTPQPELTTAAAVTTAAKTTTTAASTAPLNTTTSSATTAAASTTAAVQTTSVQTTSVCATPNVKRLTIGDIIRLIRQRYNLMYYPLF